MKKRLGLLMLVLLVGAGGGLHLGTARGGVADPVASAVADQIIATLPSLQALRLVARKQIVCYGLRQVKSQLDAGILERPFDTP